VLSVKRPVTSKVPGLFFSPFGYWSAITKRHIPKKLKDAASKAATKSETGKDLKARGEEYESAKIWRVITGVSSQIF